MQAVGT